MISFLSSDQNTALVSFFNHFSGFNFLARSSIASLNCSNGPPSTPSERMPVNHGSVDLVSSSLYLKSVRSANRLAASRASLVQSLGASFRSLMYLMAFIVVSMSWTIPVTKPTAVTGSIMTFDTSLGRQEKAKYGIEMLLLTVEKRLGQV